MLDAVMPAQVDEIQVDQEQEPFSQQVLYEKLLALKSINLADADVAIFVTEVSTANKNKRCKKAKELQCDVALKNMFRDYVVNCIQGNEHISLLTEINTNQDNRFFFVEKDATDFSQILAKVKPPQDVPDIEVVTQINELSNFNSYVIRLDFGNPRRFMYAFHFIGSSWSPKNTIGKHLRILNNDVVATLDVTPVFRIDPYIDFIVFEEDVFVSEVGRFESAMRFKERLIERKTETMAEIAEAGILADDSLEVLSSAIGTDRHFLRQLSSVQTKGFYKNEEWMVQLRAAAQAGNWMLEFNEEGNIVIFEDKLYIREVLTVLQNKRVETVVDHKVCDVDGELTDIPPR